MPGNKKSKKSKKSTLTKQSDAPISLNGTPEPTATTPPAATKGKATTAASGEDDLANRATNFVNTMNSLMGDKIEIANRVLKNAQLIESSAAMLNLCIHKGDKANAQAVQIALRWALGALRSVQGRDSEAELAAKKLEKDEAGHRITFNEAEDSFGEEEGSRQTVCSSEGGSKGKAHLRSAGLGDLGVDEGTFNVMRKNRGTGGPGTLLIYQPANSQGGGDAEDAEQSDDGDWTGEIEDVDD